MKELSLQDVLQVTGGLPDQAALDELSYGVAECEAYAATEAQRPATPPLST